MSDDMAIYEQAEDGAWGRIFPTPWRRVRRSASALRRRPPHTRMIFGREAASRCVSGSRLVECYAT